MYCDIKKRECENAGSITIKGCVELGEKPGIHTYTLCYKKGGYITCEI